MYRLLVADDENVIRKGIVETLRRSVDYFEVFEACNGKEAIETVEKESIDVLIVDVKMPKMNGIDVLRYLWENGKDLLSVVLTGYEEFDYAKSALEYGAVRYVLKPLIPSQLLELAGELKGLLDAREREKENLAMLREEFIKNRYLQKEKFFSDILRGGYEENWLFERAKLLDIKIQGPCYQVAVLGIRRYEGGEVQRREQYLIEYSINLFFEEYFKKKEDIEFFQLNSDKYILLFNRKEKGNRTQVDFLYELKEKIEEKFRIVCAIGLGPVSSHVSDIRYSYNSADFTVRCLNVRQADYVMSAEDAETDTVGTDGNFDLEDLVVSLKLGKSEDVAEKIDGLLESYLNRNENDSIGCYLMLVQIILTAFQTLHQCGGDVRALGINVSEAIKKIYEMNAVDDIKEFVQELTEEICALIRKIEEKGRNNTIKQIKNIINEEYASALSMRYIANRMYLNHIYLGQVFKKETGISLNDYINKVRINKSKKLLKESNDMVYEIAEKVGFSDPQYFSTVFKKIVGVSPKEYRDI